MNEKVIETTVTEFDVSIRLQSGKIVTLVPHKDRLHVHFSGVDKVTPVVAAANQVNINYGS